MAQTPREIIKKTLTFDFPERIGRHTWVLPWAEDFFPEQVKRLKELYPDDIVNAPNVYNRSPLVKNSPYDVGVYVDEWGCVFENIHKGIIGEVKKPAISDLSDISALHCPYETLPEDKQAAKEQVNDFCRDTDKFVLADCCPRPWERMQFLRGTVNAMMDIMTEEGKAQELLEKIHLFYMTELEFWTQTDVDGIMFMDDWGSQTNLLIPPAHWERIFKPFYADYCNIAHTNGKFAFMHSDGWITSIYPHLIEVGVDAINSQLFCMDMNELAAIAKGKITFWGEIDRQHILPSPDVEDAVEAVNKLKETLYDDAGGVIDQFEISPGSNIENAFAIHKQWQKVSSS